MTRKSIILAIMALLALGAAASADKKAEMKTFTGTWTCLACDLKQYEGLRAQCEDFGHKHCLRLDNGRYIQFLENDHSIDLVKGGGRHEAKISVRGLYDKDSRTMDIESYTIDGMTTAWCDQHHRMDMCAWQAKHPGKNEGGKSDK